MTSGLHTVTIGKGPDFIAVHGGPGLDHTYLRSGLDQLADTFRITYVDLSGNGQSDQPEGWESLSHDTWVADIERVRRDIGGKVTLFGHSYGGFIAQEYGLNHQRHLDGLILCCTAPVVDYGDRLAANAMSRGEELGSRALAAMSARARNDEAFREIWYDILPLYYHGSHEPYRSTFEDTRFSAQPYNRAYFELLGRFNTLARLSSITVPTLVLSGRHDWVMPLDVAGERIANEIPGAQHVVFDHSGHFPFHEEPERFAKAMRSWASAHLVQSV